MATTESPFRTEVHSMFLRPFLDEASDILGTDRLGELLADLGVTEAQLRDETAWVSLRFSEALLGALGDATEDPRLFERAGRLAFSKRYMGMMRPLARAFGSPGGSYAQMTRMLPRFNKVGTIDVVSQGPGRIVLRYQTAPDAPREQGRLVCAGRRGQMEGLTTLFDLPPARVDHPECMADGADACVYDVRWQPRPARWRSKLGGLLAGAAAAALLTRPEIAVSPLGAWALGIGAAVAGWALGRVVELKREVEQRARDVVEHGEALVRSVRVNEQRFEELQRAKAEVDEQVEERTAELKKTSRQLEETLEEVQALDRAKTDFFANVSHELRTPLQLVLAPLDDLLAGREPPAGRQAALSSMQHNANRLLRVINQLLDLTKIDAGQMRIRRTAVEPSSIARQVAEAFSSAAEERGVELRVDAPEAGVVTPLDSSWIESALTNLTANALRLLGSGGHLILRVLDEGADIVFEVQDDGPGLTPEQRDKVFERFTQAGGVETRRGGTGLGLAITREAARLHGGEASVREAPGGGTIFALTIPRLPLEAADDTEARADLDSEPPGPVVGPAEALAAVRQSAAGADVADRADDAQRTGPSDEAPLALVVEDNPDLRIHIADVLASRYRVEAARDGTEGVERARELHPEVVVSDIAMPRMDGIEMVRALRGDEETEAIPIILVTAYGEPARTLEAFDAGASDFVSKPFHGRELLARVDVHVRLRRMLREMTHRDRLATLGVVAASVAHQVRNPLTALVSGLPAMRKRLGDAVDDPTHEMFDMLVDCAERIERMTVDLLDLSRIDREEEGEHRPGEGVLAAARLVASRLSPDIPIDTDVDDRATLEGRAGELNHVFLNLVDTAARAVGERGRVRVEGRVDGGAYVVTVADSGPGIPEGERERIFEPFWTTRPAGEGTGLGLSIAHQVVHKHGGTIEVGVSDLGGALMTVRLPGARPSAEVEPAQVAASASST